MEKRDDWPAWGRLIDEARDRMDLSQNEAAKRAGMSGTNWRKIVKGENGPMLSPRGLRTVARMAHVVGLRPEQLAEVGREDVAEELQPAERREPQTWEELRARMDDDPEYAQAVFDLIRTAQRIGGALPAEQEEPRRHRDAG